MQNSPADFLKAKLAHRKLSMVTCYDYTFARLIANTPVDGILVGDSAGMVVHGFTSTLPVTLEMIRQHTEAVVRGAAGKFVVADLPFLTYRKGVTLALDAAQSLMTAGAHAVKLEGITGHEDAIQRMVESGIPVMGHLGLQPQSVNAYGGFRAQGRSESDAARILREAQLLEQLGAFTIVLECIPASLATTVSAGLCIPTIGIGAGAGCDGQILVLQDLLGMNTDFHPKFVRSFLDGSQLIGNALTAFDQAVKAGTFPTKEESFS